MKNEELIDIIKSYDGPKLRIMEVCGTHTHEIFRLGIRQVLPDNIELISGPGCPVCVTPVGFIDEAIMLALEKGCTVCTFGDLIRVPGSEMSLAGARAEGGKIDIVYSPMDAESYAAAHRDEQVVFLSVGFETTTPASCIAVSMAEKDGIDNFSLLTANKTMPKAYEMLKDYVDVYLYPGHVNAIMGNSECIELAKKIKELVDDKSRYADWATRDDIKNELNRDLTVLLYKNGYPPEWDEEVFEKVMQQAENFKKHMI